MTFSHKVISLLAPRHVEQNAKSTPPVPVRPEQPTPILKALMAINDTLDKIHQQLAARQTPAPEYHAPADKVKPNAT